MSPKEYLNQIKIIEVKIQIKMDQILEERTRAESCTALLSERVQTSACGDSLPNIIAKIQDYEKELDKLIDKQIDFKSEILGKIDKIDNPEFIEILSRRYVKGDKLVQIACDMNQSYSQIKRKHGWALQEFKKYM